jgi:hypothetical protein
LYIKNCIIRKLRVLRREQKSLARAFPWALGEELFTESKKRNSRRREKLSVNKFFAESQEKTLGEEFFTESKPAGSP